MKTEREDWTRLYHKTLKWLETMIDVQRMVKDIKKIGRRNEHHVNGNGGHSFDGEH